MHENLSMQEILICCLWDYLDIRIQTFKRASLLISKQLPVHLLSVLKTVMQHILINHDMDHKKTFHL